MDSPWKGCLRHRATLNKEPSRPCDRPLRRGGRAVLRIDGTTGLSQPSQPELSSWLPSNLNRWPALISGLVAIGVLVTTPRFNPYPTG